MLLIFFTNSTWHEKIRSARRSFMRDLPRPRHEQHDLRAHYAPMSLSPKLRQLLASLIPEQEAEKRMPSPETGENSSRQNFRPSYILATACSSAGTTQPSPSPAAFSDILNLLILIHHHCTIARSSSSESLYESMLYESANYANYVFKFNSRAACYVRLV